jgi:predicted metalloprotease
MKRLNALAVLAFTLFISMMVSAQAQAFDVGGLSYSVTDAAANTVEVTGRASGNTDTVIVIPASVTDSGTTYSVTNIGRNAFRDNSLTSVTIPDSVTTIGEDAFYGSRLTSVAIGNSVTIIWEGAFESNSLTTLTIPNSVTTIGNSAFFGNSLTSVTIGNSVTTIGRFAFSDNSLTSVTIPDSVTTIDNFAFASNSLTSVTIPDSVTIIGEDAFYGNRLTSVTFLGNFVAFSLAMFENNSTLETVTYEQGATGWDTPRVFEPTTGPSGSVTATLALVSPAATPSAPTATIGNGQATVTWTKPADNGSTITGYTVTSSGGQTCTTSDADTLTCVVTGLTNGTAYTFTVTATNGGGASAASVASSSITPAAPTPPAPAAPTPVFTLPLFGLGILASILGLCSLRKLRQ